MVATKVPWDALEKRTAGFSVVEAVADPSGRVDDVLVVGLRVVLSEVLAHYTHDTGATLTIYADTLVADTTRLPARGVVIVARSIDTRPIDDAPLVLQPPDQDPTAAQLLIGHHHATTDTATLTITTEGSTHTATIATGHDPLTATLALATTDGELTTDQHTDPATLNDLVERVHALNALRASFTAATWLMNATTDTELATARHQLAWILTTTRHATLAAWNELADQAAPLLAELNVHTGATYVPSLSSTFYATQIARLLDTLDTYDHHLATLATTTDLDTAIATIGNALGDVATTELAPLDAQLATLTTNLADLTTGINTLDLQFHQQTSAIDVAWANLKVALTNKQIEDWFNACFNLATSALKLSSDVVRLVASGGTDLSAIKDAITDTMTAVKTAYDGISAVSKDVTEPQQPLLDAAKSLIETQHQLMTGYVVTIGLAKATGLPTTPAVFAVAPEAAWDNYLVRATAELSRVKVGAAASYLNSLRVLVSYGKALASRVATTTQLVAQRRVVQAQRDAAAKVVDQWKQLQEQAESEAERHAALAGLVAGRQDSIRRTLFVAWRQYQAAYRYIELQTPPIVIELGHTTPRLREAFAAMTAWVGRLLGDDPSGDRIRLPDDDVEVTLELPVIALDEDAPSAEVARYAPATSQQPATLTWSVPIDTDQLNGVLPDGGNVAIWITRATFHVEGVAPNAKGNVIVRVATSGIYENGFGPAQAETFVAKSMVGSYAYQPGNDQRPYIPWSVDTELTMAPTPYTQWTMAFDPDGGDAAEATALRIELTVSFRSAP